MNKRFVLPILLALAVTATAQVDKSVKATQARYADVAEKARLAESDPDKGQYGDLVMDQLEINKLEHPWRAVGIHGITAKFFYTGGDTEQHMYPDELVLVKVERRTSDRNYREEYLYSETGTLLFSLQTAENDDTVPASRGLFFVGGKLVRVELGGKLRPTITADDRRAAADAVATSTRLKAIFANSLKL